jgi:hypothetical protein
LRKLALTGLIAVCVLTHTAKADLSPTSTFVDIGTSLVDQSSITLLSEAATFTDLNLPSLSGYAGAYISYDPTNIVPAFSTQAFAAASTGLPFDVYAYSELHLELQITGAPGLVQVNVGGVASASTTVDDGSHGAASFLYINGVEYETCAGAILSACPPGQEEGYRGESYVTPHYMLLPANVPIDVTLISQAINYGTMPQTRAESDVSVWFYLIGEDGEHVLEFSKIVGSPGPDLTAVAEPPSIAIVFVAVAAMGGLIGMGGRRGQARVHAA